MHSAKIVHRDLVHLCPVNHRNREIFSSIAIAIWKFVTSDSPAHWFLVRNQRHVLWQIT